MLRQEKPTQLLFSASSFVSLTLMMMMLAAQSCTCESQDQQSQFHSKGCGGTGLSFIPNPSNCSQYIMCAFGVASEVLACPQGFLFSLPYSVCVPHDFPSANCVKNVTKAQPTTATTTTKTATITTTTTTPAAIETLSVEERCQRNRTDVFADPQQCQLYYDCSRPDLHHSPASYLDRYMEECPYPQLFDVQTSTCRPYRNVTCGQRKEHVNECDYLRSKCVAASCVPCWVHSPSCATLPDGKNVFKGREWSPSFVVCQDGRTVSSNTCPFSETLETSQVFSPDLRRCVSLYEVPRENGGHALDCAQRKDGFYRDDVTFRPNLYFRCQGSQLASVDICPLDTTFDSKFSGCVSLENLKIG